MVELLALGPLELWHQDRQHNLGSVKQRCVLAVLLHARGAPVTAETLIDRIWDEPPATALNTLQSYLSRLRGHLYRAVGDLARVESSRHAYRLCVNPEDADLMRFQRHRADAAQAEQRGKADLAIGLLRTAESLWRGEPLAEFTSTWAMAARARLVEEHRRVQEERIRLELELGRHADLLGELQELTSQHPFAQKVIASLMLALYRCGRHDEALALYRTTRRRLDEAQGIEPGAELQQLHLRILEQDPVLMRTVRSSIVAADPESSNNLPRDTRDFTGRTSELRILLPASGHHGTQALPLTVIHGMPGIGKTTLAIHAAHQLASSYPDGQFYVDLHAYNGQPPYDPAEALAVLLHAVGTSDPLPDSLDERAARWRAWTARRRALVILDNARDAAQVSPLLPGAPTCRVIVTSRNRLADLDGAMPLFLDALSVAEAATLFTRVAGTARLRSDTARVRHIVNACSCHPLAVQLLASHFRHRDSWDLDHLIDRLADTAGPLSAFDPSVASAFRLTYTELSTPARRLFRRLALHPGPDITLSAVTALGASSTATERETAQAHRGVEELLDCHLLEEHVRDRYRLHDLTRAFGLQMCAQEEPAASRRAALERLLGYYLTTAHRASQRTHARRRTLPVEPEHTSPYALEFGDEDEALVWLTVERANLVAVARKAAAEAPEFAALFPRVLASSFKLWGTWDVAAELYGAAVSTIRQRGDHAALAWALVEHADLLAQKRHDEALQYAAEALTLFKDQRDARGCADALLQNGRAQFAAGRGDTALHVLGQALLAYREVHDQHGEAECLNVQGAALFVAGRYNEVLHKVQAMLDVYEGLHDQHGQAKAWNNMGELYYRKGCYEAAQDCYERSLDLEQRRGGRQELAILDTNLGAVYQATGQTSRALTCYQRALTSHRASGDTLGEANALISMGTAYAETGRKQEALLQFNMAEEAARSIDNPYERQRALIGLAEVQRESGRLNVAHKIYEQARKVAQSIGFPLGCAHALAGLARTSLSSGHVELARHYGQQAVTLYQELEATPEAESLQRLLLDLGATGS